jgi:membrane-bound lytic murein transglycosylase D
MTISPSASPIRTPLLTLAASLILLPGCPMSQQVRVDLPEPVAVASGQQTRISLPLPRPQPLEMASLVKPVKVHGEQHDAGECAGEHNLWQRLRSGFSLIDQVEVTPRLQQEIDWYLRNPDYIARVVERARPYLYLIVEETERRGIPLEIALLPVVESAFQPFAYSHGRAAGLWQFIPGTGKRFKLRQNWWYDGRRDIAESTRAALDYLEYLRDYFKGDWMHALAAYNSGEGTVGRAIRTNREKGKATDYWSLNLPRETEGYVPKLIAISRVVADPSAHGIALAPIDDEPFLVAVDVGSQIDMDLAAELADLTIEEIYLYNPGVNRWATDPHGNHQLLIPIDRQELFLAGLEHYPADKRITWQRHTVKAGENLSTIAERYHTTIALIKEINQLKSTTLRAGQSLTIPQARSDLASYRLSATERLAALQARPRDGERIEYTVQSGDTLWSVARRHQVGVRQLASWNGMAPRDPLLPGRRLVIWSQAGNEPSARAQNPAEFIHPFEQNTVRRIGYTVRQGDSLARIAERFKVSVENLRRWNQLEGKKYIKPGQRLTLYVDVIRQSGA